MGYLRRLDNNADIQAFPGANFEAAGEIPKPQCTEAQIEGTGAYMSGPPKTTLVDVGNFAGFDLSGKVCHITAITGGTPGDYAINWNDANTLSLAASPGPGTNIVYHVTDAGEFELTRNVASLAAYIHAAGYAYTFKAGKLYTNMPSGLLKNACTILFDPIT